MGCGGMWYDSISSLLGPYALCRVMKRVDQKTNDVHGGTKSKQLGSSSTNEDFNSTGLSTKAAVIPSDAPSQTASYVECESNFSSPLTSPYQATSVIMDEPIPMLPNPSNCWVSPDLILDSSKGQPQAQERQCDFFPQNEYSSSVTAWQEYGNLRFRQVHPTQILQKLLNLQRIYLDLVACRLSLHMASTGMGMIFPMKVTFGTAHSETPNHSNKKGLVCFCSTAGSGTW